MLSWEEHIKSADSRIPLKVLVIDPDDSSAGLLLQILKDTSEVVSSVKRVRSLDEARSVLKKKEINTIYIDPLLLGLDVASEFIFEIRRRLPTMVFVLYLDLNQVEQIQYQFYNGERQRFKHYLKLDKLTPVAIFDDAIKATIMKCQRDLLRNLKIKRERESARIEKEKIEKTVDDIKRDAASIQVEKLRTKIMEKIERLEDQMGQSHRRTEEEIARLRQLVGTSEEFLDWKAFSTNFKHLKETHITKEVFDAEIQRLDEKTEKGLENLEKRIDEGTKALNIRIRDLKEIKFWSKRTLLEIALAIWGAIVTLYVAGILRF